MVSTNKKTLQHSHRSSGEVRNPEPQHCVYLLANKRNGILYVGVTSNLIQRVWQHKSDLVQGFTQRYGIHTLVWYGHTIRWKVPSCKEGDQGMETDLKDGVD